LRRRRFVVMEVKMLHLAGGTLVEDEFIVTARWLSGWRPIHYAYV